MKKRLYYHKTDGGAEYLSDTFISWKNDGKSGREGTVTDKTRTLIRIDGDITKDVEVITDNYLDLLDALKTALRELEWLDKNALIKSRAGGDYIEVESLAEIRTAIKKVEGV